MEVTPAATFHHLGIRERRPSHVTVTGQEPEFVPDLRRIFISDRADISTEREPDESKLWKRETFQKSKTLTADKHEGNGREDTHRQHRPGKRRSAAVRQRQGHQKAEKTPGNDPVKWRGSTTDCRIHRGSGGGLRRHARPF